MKGIEYIFELCEGLPRSGPGANEFTRKALGFAGALPKDAIVLDIGCGQGMQTIELAKHIDGEIIALDIHDGFLDLLMLDAKAHGLENKIAPLHKSMTEMDFEDSTFDLIWSEGAMYLMGFANGLKKCHQLLKDKGCLAVSELVYTSDTRPEEISDYLEGDYPDIKTIECNRELIHEAGYEIVADFTLPESAWLDSYYLPMEKRIPLLKEKYQDNKTAIGVLNYFQEEINYYKKYSAYYSYQFFVLKKQ